MLYKNYCSKHIHVFSDGSSSYFRNKEVKKLFIFNKMDYKTYRKNKSFLNLLELKKDLTQYRKNIF